MAQRQRRNHYRKNPTKPVKELDPDAWTDPTKYPPPDHKYGAKPKSVGDILFPSTSEANRWEILLRLEREGEISDLHCSAKYKKGVQLKRDLGLRYDFRVNDVLIGSYEPDFVYKLKDGSQVVEDVKGMHIPVYNLKKRMMRAFYGIIIKEVSTKDARIYHL